MKVGSEELGLFHYLLKETSLQRDVSKMHLNTTQVFRDPVETYFLGFLLGIQFAAALVNSKGYYKCCNETTECSSAAKYQTMRKERRISGKSLRLGNHLQ